MIRKFSVFFALSLIASPPLAFADIPAYGDGKPTSEKINYCEGLVGRWGKRSSQINDGWYGKRVQRPQRSAWEIDVRESFFGGDLFIVFEQKTTDGFTHRASCLWSDDAPWFEFRIRHHELGNVPVCYMYGDSDGYGCP